MIAGKNTSSDPKYIEMNMMRKKVAVMGDRQL